MNKYYAIDKFLDFLADFLHGKLRKDQFGYTLDLYKGTNKYYSLYFDNFGVYEGSDEFTIKRNVAKHRKYRKDANIKEDEENTTI